jgi:hypothetical protein
VITGAHRSLGHTLLFPAALAVVVAVDLRRPEPFVHRLAGPAGGAVAAAGLFAMTAAGIGLDYVVNGVNLFWPVHDQFFAANGRHRSQRATEVAEAAASPGRRTTPTTAPVSTHSGATSRRTSNGCSRSSGAAGSSSSSPGVPSS